MTNTDILIIGGGAAGLMAACAAGQSARQVNATTKIILLEKNDRVGRKLLATGNGRCNLSNTDMQAIYYHSRSPHFVKQVLAERSLEETLSFFMHLGLRTVSEEGRIYPYSQTATAVLDVLRLEAEHLGVRVVTGNQVVSASYRPHPPYFIIKTDSDDKFSCQKLIIATGGMAAPATGSDGAGAAWLSDFGHSIEPYYPALTPLTAKHPALKILKGIRIKPARLTLMAGKHFLAAETGELLFTEYGLSGIPAMQVSGSVCHHTSVTGYIDLLPDMTLPETFSYLQSRRAWMGYLPLEHLFTGMLHKQVGQAILNDAGLRQKTTSIDSLTDRQLEALSSVMKQWIFSITGVKGYTFAQVSGGGALLSEFNPCDLQSLKIPGLYAAGEILDVHGDCGGYNLHWAWITGFLAGSGAVRAVRTEG